KMSFMRPHIKGRLVAEGTIAKRGRRIAFTEAVLTNVKKEILAKCNGTWLIMPAYLGLVMSSKRPVELGRDVRLFLLFLSEINLVMGALFFVYPSLVIGLWPWQVKAL